VQSDWNRDTILFRGAELPLSQSFDSLFVEAESEAPDNSNDLDGTVLLDDSFQNDRALITRFTCFFGVLRLNLINNRWCTHTAAHSKDAATVAAAFTRTDTRAFSRADAATGAITDSAAETRSGRRWSRYALRIAKI